MPSACVPSSSHLSTSSPGPPGSLQGPPWAGSRVLMGFVTDPPDVGASVCRGPMPHPVLHQLPAAAGLKGPPWAGLRATGKGAVDASVTAAKSSPAGPRPACPVVPELLTPTLILPVPRTLPRCPTTRTQFPPGSFFVPLMASSLLPPPPANPPGLASSPGMLRKRPSGSLCSPLQQPGPRPLLPASTCFVALGVLLVASGGPARSWCHAWSLPRD